MAYRLDVAGSPCSLTEVVVGRVTTRPIAGHRPDFVFLDPGRTDDLEGYAAVLMTKESTFRSLPARTRGVGQLPYRDHLAEGDIVRLDPSGHVRTLFKHGSPHNAIFTTDRCNSFCLMCSQPPKRIDDRDRIAEHLRLVQLIDPATEQLGVTGGEPTLLRDDFVRLLEACKRQLPSTALHVLSNGRLFAYDSFARAVAKVGHPDLVFGVPIYSDLDYVHDFVVQARGAFEETVRGLHNLARHGVRVELRVVVHRLTADRLAQTAEFIYRNLTFAEHVALMGLEITGFAVPNLERLWIDPSEYGDQLTESVRHLSRRGMTVSVYNHPLCVVPPEIWPSCRRSISDWKNEYLEICAECVVREQCGGFFMTSRRRLPEGIHPLAAAERGLRA
jgi:His-Xaa-Ser system radical SAM maturase HxsC